MRKLFGGVVFLLICNITVAQNFSNKGKDFWVAYGYHQVMTAGNAQNMVLYFATDQVTTVTVSIPGIGYTQTYANIAANTVFTSNAIPKAGLQDARLLNESTAPEDKGIHIVADKPIVAYAHIYNASVSGASILFPTNTLGKEYYSINYDNISNSGGANCWFYVIACDEGTTTVEIIPSANTLTHTAGVPFTITLTQGQVYNFMGQLTGGGGGTFTGVDLTGSKIRSIASASGACKRIAVFSGSGRISLTCNGAAASSDNYMVQAFPKSAWGKKFLTAPTGGLPNNIFRVCVSDPTANITINGAPIAYPLENNFFYEIPAGSTPLRIESDLPVTVAQYITSNNNCGNTVTGSMGDPEVIYLSPVEQNISKVIWNATPNFAINTHYYTVVIPNTGTAISSFRLDGNPVSPFLFIPHPQAPGYSYLTQTVGAGQRRIESDSGFNAIAYGYGANESYGYNAGTNVRDLLQKIGVKSEYGIEETPSVCIGSPFKFKVSLPYMVDSMRWNLSNLPGSPPNVLMTYSNPPVPADADSTTTVNGKTVYWYSLPSFYNFNTVGVYPVTITAYASTSEGCGNEQQIDFELEVNNPPTAGFNWTHNGCVDQSVQFNDQTVSVKPTYRWWWSFGDLASGTANNTSTLQNPVHTFSGPGTYTVRYSNITTPGCLSDTISKQIVIHPLPVANISGDITVCHNAPSPNVVFTGTTGTAPFTFTYNINNGPAQTITTTTGNSIALPVPTGTTGTFNYHLVNVRDAAGTAGCFQNMPDTVRVIVNPLPTATIGGTITVCQNAAAPSVTFTAAGGSVPPFTFSYNINGGAVQTIPTTTGNSVTLTVPTGTPGTFVYNLESVRDASATGCSQVQTGAATVIVNPLPTATLTGTTEVCLNGTPPTVVFTGAGSTSPYTFTYTLNGGPAQTITSTGNTAPVTVPTTTAGIFVYNLLSVRDASGTTCSRAQTGTATVTVHPLPTAGFNFTAPTCVTRTISFTDNSAPNVGALDSWSWDFGDPASGANNISSLPNPTHVFATPGTYTVTLVVTNNEGCTSASFQRTVTISTLPTAGFTLPEVCLLDPSASFSDLSTAINPSTITTWQWTYGDPGSGANNTSTASNGQHTYSAVGNYNVRLVVTTNNGCTDTLTQQLTVNGGNPVANFIQLNPTSTCSSDTAVIQNKSTIASGVITKVVIHWDNTNQPTVFETDEDPLFDKIYKHKYPTSTNTINYNVRFRAYSGGVCVNDRILPVRVLATPDVAIANIPDQCYTTTPLVLNFGTESGGVVGATTYSGPGVSFNGTNWVFNSTTAGIGTHTIQYKFTATAGACADSVSTTIKVLDTATARFSLQGPACEKNTVSFTEQSTAPTGISIANTVWNFGDGTAPETHPVGGTVTHTYASANTYTVTMYNVSATGCRSIPATQQVVVAPIPAPNFTFPASLCLPAATAAFINTSTIANGTENTFTHLWNFGDPSSGANNTSTDKDPTHIYYGAGPYNVKLQVTSGAGCVHDTSIQVNTIHPQPKANFDISRAAICLGDNVSFTDRSNGADGTITNWTWNFDDASPVSHQPNPSHLYTTADNYDVSLFITNSHGCNSDTLSKSFKVYAKPTVNAGPDVFVLESGSETLEPTYTGEDNIYLWSPSDFLNSTTVARPVTTPLRDITYTITVSNPGGCSVSDDVFVKVLKGPKIPNTFSPNGDGINDKWIIEYLDTYPNCKVVVFTRAGQKVFESRGYKVPWNGTMNGKTLPLDTYYYIIEPENGRKPVTGYVTIIK